MKIIKEYDRICLNDNGKILSFLYGGNLDLYWIINSEDDKSFEITKENYSLYSLFEKLFDDIDSINFYRDIPPYISTYSELESHCESEENDKRLFREKNAAHYNELYNKEKQEIKWYSDETNMKVSNYFIIKKLDEKFVIEFHTQEYIDGYSPEFNNENSISVRICNSGSHHDPFNILFMMMFNEMKNIDNTSDINHQYHIEEYLYRLSLEKKR